MKNITNHVIPGNVNDDHFTVTAADEPGPGGAHHHYILGHGGRGVTHLNFQNGGVSEVGPNGITEAQLIAVLIHRLEAFQSGPFRSRENAITITKLEEALMWQQQRTMNRMRKGIEGRSVVDGPAQPDPDVIPGLMLIRQAIGCPPEPVRADLSNVIAAIANDAYDDYDGTKRVDLVFGMGGFSKGISMGLPSSDEKVQEAARIAVDRALDALKGVAGPSA